MNILVPFLKDGKIQQLQKSTDEVSELLDNILRQFNEAQKIHNLNRSKTILIINDIDLLFIKEYYKIQSVYSLQPPMSVMLFGFNVRKMKQKGFIFAYE